MAAVSDEVKWSNVHATKMRDIFGDAWCSYDQEMLLEK